MSLALAWIQHVAKPFLPRRRGAAKKMVTPGILFAILSTLFLLASAFPLDALAATAEVQSANDAVQLRFTINNVWLLFCTALVFIMHLGFASLEAGLTRAKNTVNILYKNVGILAVGTLTYAIVGFNLMFPGEEFAGSVLSFGRLLQPGGIGVAASQADLTPAYGDYTYWTAFIFQAMFAATAATIVSGAVAERIKLSSFFLFSVIYIALVYPTVGMWQWGGGWLSTLGFYDFAGSTVVHSVGGWAALAGIIVIGPRTGKYAKGAIRPIMGHSMPLATIGVLLLWFGWFGFNGGSVLSADPGVISYVFVTTMLGASTGVVGATLTSLVVQRKPDISMALNGVLAGLVGVTAGADVISIGGSLVIGVIAGAIVVASVVMFDRVRIDDPVGAVSVHLVCGIWGTLAVGLFSSDHSILAQLIGVLATGALCFPFGLFLFYAVKRSVGLRVSRAEELQGLDIGEHGMEAYSGFQIFTTH